MTGCTDVLYSFQTAGRKGHGSLVTLHLQCQVKLNTFKTILSTFIFTIFIIFSSFSHRSVVGKTRYIRKCTNVSIFILELLILRLLVTTICNTATVVGTYNIQNFLVT